MKNQLLNDKSCSVACTGLYADVAEDYKQDMPAYSLVTLLKSGVNSEFRSGTKLVVPTHMIEELEIFGEKHYIVLENHVVGVFDN